MIVRAIESRLWLFAQRDHSRLAGALARAWGAPFGAPPPEVLRAAELHDSGWPEWDAMPRLDPETGRPHPYSRMPDADYRQIWRRGLARGWAEGEATGLLISLHAMRFFAQKQLPADVELLREQRVRQADALRALSANGTEPEALPEPYATWHAWMFFWDGLSLFLCEAWSSPWHAVLPGPEGERVELTVTRSRDAPPGAEVRVDPFPFAAPLELEVPARVIPDRAYPSQQELDEAVADAEPRVAEFSLRRR